MFRRLTRRTVIAAVGLAATVRSASGQDAPSPARSDLAFAVWRNGTHIGRHRVTFESRGPVLTVGIEAEMLVKFGPLPVFNYHHQATETWRDGRFAALQSHTVTNGKREAISASRTAGGVGVVRDGGRAPVEASADARPLTHWNPAVLEGPLFNPQTGALVHVRVLRVPAQPLRLAGGRLASSTRYDLHGDAEVVDWYDEGGAWAALKAKAPDGSLIDYRREA